MADTPRYSLAPLYSKKGECYERCERFLKHKNMQNSLPFYCKLCGNGKFFSVSNNF